VIITTKRGDGGEASLVGGIRVSKGDLRVEAYGTIDERARRGACGVEAKASEHP
jgi:cob(I)alamin adenosyltransferase